MPNNKFLPLFFSPQATSSPNQHTSQSCPLFSKASPTLQWEPQSLPSRPIKITLSSRNYINRTSPPNLFLPSLVSCLLLVPATRTLGKQTSGHSTQLASQPTASESKICSHFSAIFQINSTSSQSSAHSNRLDADSNSIAISHGPSSPSLTQSLSLSLVHNCNYKQPDQHHKLALTLTLSTLLLELLLIIVIIIIT